MDVSTEDQLPVLVTEEREDIESSEGLPTSNPEIEYIIIPSPAPSHSQSHSDSENPPSVEIIPRASVQSTLDVFRPPPVLPNLALLALQRLKDKGTSEQHSEEDDDFKPTKKRRLEEPATEDEV